MGPSKDLNLMEEGEASRTRLLDSDNNVAHSNDVVIFNTMFVNISTILYIFAFFRESVLNILSDFALYGFSILKSLILKRYKIHLYLHVYQTFPIKYRKFEARIRELDNNCFY